MTQETVYSEDPVAMARHWEALGATWLHVVDLDGAVTGTAHNREMVEQIVRETHLHPQVGGGIRDLQAIERWLHLGVHRVVLGTAAVQNPHILEEACQHFPGQIAVAIDTQKGRVAVKGWTEVTELDAVTFAHCCACQGVAALVVTDIQRDGTLEGPNLDQTKQLAAQVTVPVILSGGIGSLADLKQVKHLESHGVIGVIVGRALYSGAIDFQASKRILEDA
jgi:phosphoribosylformimino-5-aminoimidazole carboxamide ribotide isomerase